MILTVLSTITSLGAEAIIYPLHLKLSNRKLKDLLTWEPQRTENSWLKWTNELIPIQYVFNWLTARFPTNPPLSVESKKKKKMNQIISLVPFDFAFRFA